MDKLDAIIESLPFFTREQVDPITPVTGAVQGRGPLSVRDFRLLQFLVAVELTALLLSRWVFTWLPFPRYRRDDFPTVTAKRTLEAIIWALFNLTVADGVERELRTEQAKLSAAIKLYEAGNRSFVAPTYRPPLQLWPESYAKGRAHIVRAVLLRVIEVRDDEDGPCLQRNGAWLEEFRHACLKTEPRLITPVSLETLARRLQRLRKRADLSSVKQLGLRRSHRSIGLPLLRAWGLRRNEE